MTTDDGEGGQPPIRYGVFVYELLDGSMGISPVPGVEGEAPTLGQLARLLYETLRGTEQEILAQKIKHTLAPPAEKKPQIQIYPAIKTGRKT